ncbi:MAG: ribonuclease Y [Calditrichaeota bacterium]|nr:MAG: ribonuclease Y [Calditrichota bacterium]
MVFMIIIFTLVVGFVVGWFLRQHIGQEKIAKANQFAKKIIEEAQAESEDLKREKLLEARDEIFKQKQEFEREAKSKLSELHRLEKQLSSRELNIDRKVDVLSKKEQELRVLESEVRNKEEFLKKREEELEKLIEEENRRLEQISGLTQEEAKQIQLKNVLDKARLDAAQEVMEIREKAKQTAAREAREILIQALQRSSISHVVETTISSVHLPDDDMKGRIIGREGRNIRSFESATGVEVLIDDTPQTVVLSSFDPIRREIARISLEKLIADGRIHPARIEEVVEKTRDEVNQRIIEIGEQAIHEVGVHGIHQELVRLLGRQYFHTAYGQNLLQHSKEVAILSGQIASLMGLDINLAKRAGLLHDIGKTAQEYGDAPPHEIGVELAKKFGEGPVVQNVIAAQNITGNVEIISPITVLVQVADSISISRPGAQKEMLESYLNRLQKLEEIAKSFSGVVSAYALQAGKEVRVIVEHNVVDDKQAQILSENVAERIKKEVEHAGQIKVVVIREFRAIDYAK